MENEEVVEVEESLKLGHALKNAIGLTFLAFLGSLALYIVTGTPRFGYYLISASAVYTCYVIAAWVFTLVMGWFGLRRIVAYSSSRKEEKETPEKAS